MKFSIHEITQACANARIVAEGGPDSFVTDVSWDSRQVHPGDLYISIPGAHVDGNDFVCDAIGAGAACALMTRAPHQEEIDAARAHQAGIVVCDDAMEAIVDLARTWRTHMNGRVIGVTGSTGKTTTKNLLGAVLAKAGTVVVTRGNQNNELGVPATILHAHTDTSSVVVEMGMRGLGQLSAMCAYVRPQMALITNVGTSHIELLGSRENIARAKSEIIDGLPDTGTAFLNVSGDFTRRIYEKHIQSTHKACIFFDGSGEDPLNTISGLTPQVYAKDISFDENGCATFTLCTPNSQAKCTLQIPGAHNVHNACAAAAVGYACGIHADDLSQALSSVIPMKGRDKLIHARGGYIVIDDAYNANPDSMRASLETFKKMDINGRKIAVLGDMGELGDYAKKGHFDTGICAASANIDYLICVGVLSRDIARGASHAGMDATKVFCIDDADGALALIEKLHITPNDAILVKASHSTGLDRVVEGLVER